MTEHVDIADAERHEPKGASSAAVGTILRSNGDGTTSWAVPSAVIDPSAFTVEEVINSTSTATSQEPGATDTILQVTFGAAANGPSDPAQIDVAGNITINQTGLYKISFYCNFGRTSGTSTSNLFLRRLVNGIQVGRSVAFVVTSTDILIPFEQSEFEVLTATDIITYEIIRDSTGDNSGGLLQGNPTPATWNDSPCAEFKLERFVAV